MEHSSSAHLGGSPTKPLAIPTGSATLLKGDVSSYGLAVSPRESNPYLAQSPPGAGAMSGALSRSNSLLRPRSGSLGRSTSDPARHLVVGDAATRRALATEMELASAHPAQLIKLMNLQLEVQRASMQSYERVVETVERELSRVIGAARCVLFLASRTHLSWLLDTPQEAPLAISITGYVATSGQVLCLNRPSNDPRYNEGIDNILRGSTTELESLLCVPCADSQGKNIGVLALANKMNMEKHAEGFNSEDQALVTVLAQCVGIAVESTTQRTTAAARIAALEQRQAEMESLLNCGREVTTQLAMDHVIESVMARCKSLLNADRCSLFLVDVEQNELYSHISEGTSAFRVPIGTGIAGYVAQTAETLCIDDVYADARFNPQLDRLTGYTTRNMLCCPIMWQQNIVGVVQMMNKLDGAFTQADQALMAEFVVFCGIAINNARLYEAVCSHRDNTELMLEFAKAVASDLDVPATVQTIMDKTRALLTADRCTVFLVDNTSHELYSFTADGTENIRIPMSRGIAGTVATTGKAINLADVYEDPRFNKEVDRRTGYRTKSMLCMPVRHKGALVGVTQIINKAVGAFTRSDEELFEAFSAFCGMSIKNAQLYDAALDTQRRMKLMLKVAGALTTGGADQENTQWVRSLLEYACRIVDSDRLSLLLVDEKEHEMWSKSLGDEDIRFTTDEGVAGHVARTGMAVNISNANEDPRFIKAVDHPVARDTTGLLAVPVVEGERVTGVIEATNKRTGSFTPADRELLTAFASYCGVTNMPEMPIAVEGDPSLEEFIARFEVSPAERILVRSWNLKPWEYSQDKLIAFAILFFEDLGLVSTFNISRHRLYRFVCHVAQRYHRHVIYHNFVHAFDVTHALYMFIREGDMESLGLTKLDMLTGLVAALCHDIDHQGYTNAFMAASGSPFALLYTHGSIMENHHTSVAISILSERYCDIFASLPEAEHKEVWASLVPTILATDVSNKEDDTVFREMVTNNSFDRDNTAHRKLLMRQLMKLADISNGIRPLEIARRWAGVVSTEFYNQGDKERASGLPVTPICDREKTDLPSMQKGFLNYMVRPALAIMTRFNPRLAPLVGQVDINFDYWAAQMP